MRVYAHTAACGPKSSRPQCRWRSLPNAPVRRTHARAPVAAAYSAPARLRTARKRTASAGFKVFNAETRAEILRKKLKSLEADNWVEERTTADDDDEEYIHQASDGDGACPTLFCRSARHHRHAH